MVQACYHPSTHVRALPDYCVEFDTERRDRHLMNLLNSGTILTKYARQTRMIHTMMDLTAFQRDLLYTIAGLEEPKGVEVKDAMERYYGTEIRHGRLYPNLDSLVEKALVRKGQHDHRTNKYVLTERGKHSIQSRIEWELASIPDELEGGIKSLPKRS